MKRARGFPMPTGLGASGALIGLVVAYALAHPEARLGILFLPGVDFSAAEAVIGLVGFDVCGLLMGWGVLGHAAHLSGAAAGAFLASDLGRAALHQYCTQAARAWDKARGRL
jgi:membrane associated rhomboid family serine protease